MAGMEGRVVRVGSRELLSTYRIYRAYQTV